MSPDPRLALVVPFPSPAPGVTSSGVTVTMKRLLCLLLVSCCVASCSAPAQRRAASSNAAVTVDLMVEFDGVRLYRVDVGDRHVYVAVSGTRLSAEWMEQQGKIQVPVSVDTVRSSR